MANQDKIDQTCNHWLVLALLSVILMLSYSNSLNASWHLDDFHNITEKSRFHTQDLYPKTIYKAVIEDSGHDRIFYRPVSNLSLVLNWYFSKTDVTSYHIVNITIHILTTFFLYLAILALLKSPRLTGKYRHKKYFIALLAATIWALNPIQTQAVTYIVQRMAAMAAMFYVLGIYLYVKVRTCGSWKNRLWLYSGVFMAFILAVGSKENAIIFPASLLLVEIIFFQDMSEPKTRKRFIYSGIVLLVSLFAIGTMLFMTDGFISRIQDGYAGRTFTLSERLLTEPRIVVFYLSQIFYPIADRLSIVHDFELATNLFSPWTTLPAILLIAGFIAIAFWQINKRPLLSFAVLFFFLNHVIESTIIPLEPVFEHRNYLPSLFLFVPIAAGLKHIIDYYREQNKAMAHVLTGFVTALVMVLGIGTYVRNMAWANEATLWQDALEKAPNSARPYQNLAAGYYSEIGDYDRAQELCEKAINLNDSTIHKAKLLSLENIANIYAKRDKDYLKAIEMYSQILKIDPDRSSSRYHLVLALIHTDQFERALENIDVLLSEKPEAIHYLNAKSFALLKNNEPEHAHSYLIKAISQNPDDERALISMGIIRSLTGNFRSAEYYLSRIKDGSPQKTMALLLQIENSIRAGDVGTAEDFAKRLVSKASPESIRKTIEEANKPGMLWPVSTDLVAPVIGRVLREQSEMFSSIELAHGSK